SGWGRRSVIRESNFLLRKCSRTSKRSKQRRRNSDRSASSAAGERFVLFGGKGNDRQSADSYQRRSGKNLVGLDFRQGNRFTQQLSRCDFDLRILGIRILHRNNRSRSYRRFVVTGLIDDQFVARLHGAEMPECDRIVHAVPHGLFVLLQVGEGIFTGFCLEQIGVGHGVSLSTISWDSQRLKWS